MIKNNLFLFVLKPWIPVFSSQFLVSSTAHFMWHRNATSFKYEESFSSVSENFAFFPAKKATRQMLCRKRPLPPSNTLAAA
jgi:hypothetical protein